MPRSSWIFPPEQWNTAQVVADIDTIRQYNPQRFEMEQLTAIIHEDLASHVCVGYKELTTTEFWVRGLVLQTPIMPPILMCEAAAQLANYYALKHGLYKALGGFVGLRRIRYRGIARPGERLFVLAKLLKIRGTLLTCQFQCAIRTRMVCEGILMGGRFPWTADQRRNTTWAATVTVGGG